MLDMFCMIIFLQVIAIQKNLFQSTDFILTTTELKDHIKAMVTLLEDPTELKNDAHATLAVKQLHQVKQNWTWIRQKHIWSKIH